MSEPDLDLGHFSEPNGPSNGGADDSPSSERRRGLVRRALDAWKKQLVDLGGRNNLLYYRHLKVGTLDLTACDPVHLQTLLEGRSVTLSKLFPDPERLEDARGRARAIHKKALEHYEERGIETLFLAYAMATWTAGIGRGTPRAPVLLRPAILNPRGAAQEDFDLVLTSEMQISPTLLHFLESEFGLIPDQSQLELDGVIDSSGELNEVVRWLKAEAAAVPGFDVSTEMILGTFSYMKLPMVRDLEDAYEVLVAHDLVAALAGDDDARKSLRERYAQVAVSLEDPNHTPPSDEFLILDADSSQNYAINAVLAGQDLIVRGPPGTGKSQTIANLIATLAARGQRVLFVAEKRAAIEAVLKRLDQVGLADLVFDLHGGVAARRQVAQELARSLGATGTIPLNDRRSELQQLERRRDELNARAEAFHRRREPWGVSVHEAQVGIIGTRETAMTGFRLRGDALDQLTEEAHRDASENLFSYAGLGGFTLASSGSPWAEATVTSPDEASDAIETIARIRRHTLPAASRVVRAAASETSINLSDCLDDWRPAIDLWRGVAATLAVFSPEIYGEPLEQLCAALSPVTGGRFRRFRAALTSSAYRAARKTLRRLAQEKGVATLGLFTRAAAAADEARRWTESAETGSKPAAPAQLSVVVESHEQLLRELEHLSRYIPRSELGRLSEDSLSDMLDRLLADQPTLAKLPELHRLEGALHAAGLGELLAELRERQLSPDLTRGCLRYAWLQSILERVRTHDPLIGAFEGRHQTETVNEFRDLDRDHIESTADRVLRLWAERVVEARDTFPDQGAQVKLQAGRKRKLMPFRQLFAESKDLLLELKPCWVMSPLVVSQVLPAERLFDVVVFDESSQIRPADAVPAIARGERLVLAGDERQLPPTAFFLTASPEEEEQQEEQPSLAATEGFESVLENLGMLLPFRMLIWHYRSHDERLIAFSNAYLYDRSLTTFPGVGGDEPVSHVLVPFRPGQPSQEESASDEVAEVVRRIIEHAKKQPSDTLGVIAMGIRHANRIEEALRQALQDHNDLEEFFSEVREERFFVKNLERVQGDERDAIILSVGYGKSADGRMLYRFGPLNMEGGERRLNVAVTRARKRMTVVSSFGSADMDPDRLRAQGAKLLRAYLQFAQSGASSLGERVFNKPPLNPFEIDVRDTLARHGLPLVAQLGVSGYWIDFAAKHPLRSGQFVLAIECDGASYHSTPTARDRDRLRQEQLERLGWRFHRIWSADWFANKDEAVTTTLAACEEAVEAANRDELARPNPGGVDASTPTHALGNPNPPVAVAAAKRSPRPPIPRNRPIGYYTHRQLVSLVRWIESDTLLRTEDELLAQVMQDLGFERRGKNVVAAIRQAIRYARRVKPS